MGFSVFQFTHPGRGATGKSLETGYSLYGFNSRTPGGVRPSKVIFSKPSIAFQFTHPGRGATTQYRQKESDVFVSIHAPREGCDYRRSGGSTFPECFNSRTPGGVRLAKMTLTEIAKEFQFTHPGRGATLRLLLPLLCRARFQFTHPGRGATLQKLIQRLLRLVSIHAPREGCDCQGGRMTGTSS